MTSFDHGIAGALGTQLAMIILYPLDLIRTKQQVEESHKVSRRNSRFGIVFGSLFDVINDGGVTALYRGLCPTLQTLGVSYFVYFFAYNYTIETIKYTTDTPITVVSDLFCSCVGGVINVMATSPLWVAATRLKMYDPPRHTDSNFSLLCEMRDVQRTEGVSALWGGLCSSLILVTNPIIQFSVYFLLKRRFAPTANGISSQKAFLFGAIAKFFATVVTYPLQVAQSRLRYSKTQVKDSVGLRQSTWSCLRDLFHERGIPGLFIGIETKITQTVMNSALMFLFYERILRSIQGFKGVLKN